VICRCLASMKGVVLLSEIHPRGGRMFNPVQQAAEWYGLLQPAEVQALQQRGRDFTAAIGLIAQRCAEQDKVLVLRDWSHLDFIGLPFMQPDYRPRLQETLQSDFDLVRLATVRHPLDQWLSLVKNPVFAEQLPLSKYLKGVRRFAEMAEGTGFIQYERFAADPDTVLQQLCAALQLPFDASYRERWAEYRNITGDVLPGRAASDAISSLPRQQNAQSQLEAFRTRADYGRILQLLNYTD